VSYELPSWQPRYLPCSTFFFFFSSAEKPERFFFFSSQRKSLNEGWSLQSHSSALAHRRQDGGAVAWRDEGVVNKPSDEVAKSQIYPAKKLVKLEPELVRL
jgi:hypothetical protein